jgi:hypothetical protein
MLLSLTRAALYGLSITIVSAYLWYLINQRGRLFSFRPVLAVFLIISCVIVFGLYVGSYNEYAQHKLTTFFDTEEILYGQSSGFRLMSQSILLDAFLATDRTALIGNGWGQVRFAYGDLEFQAGGADILVVLAYGGLLAGILYALFFVAAGASMMRMSNEPADQDTQFYRGVMFALMGLFITGQISGSLNAPEYWLVVGLAIYVDIRRLYWLQHRLATGEKF